MRVIGDTTASAGASGEDEEDEEDGEDGEDGADGVGDAFTFEGKVGHGRILSFSLLINFWPVQRCLHTQTSASTFSSCRSQLT
jgi:hypothetical protein